jgi:hypothetical protein
MNENSSAIQTRPAPTLIPGREPQPMLQVDALSDAELRYWIQRMRRLIWQHSHTGASPAASQRLAHHRSRLVIELDRLRLEAAARHL